MSHEGQSTRRLRVIDSHTEGEPTRVVVSGGPDLGTGTAAEHRDRLRDDWDELRRTVVLEPRGYDAMVGALLLPAASEDAVARAIFFNNVGYLGMCVHGTIGVARTLAWMGTIDVGRHRLETPVGDVEVELAEDGLISVDNVVSYRVAESVEVETEDHGVVAGDIAWGGNWFFLVGEHGQRLDASRIPALTDYCLQIRHALDSAGIVGSDGGAIDHIELFGPPQREDADSRNFVLCPGGEYDRSPCGTGTSAKMACLWADGKLPEGRLWRQESIIGSRFVGSVREVGEGVLPTVSGRAWITAEGELVRRPDDPFRAGIER